MFWDLSQKIFKITIGLRIISFRRFGYDQREICVSEQGRHDLAIIEVETKIDNKVLPISTDGKIRICEVKVLREALPNKRGR